MKKETQLQNDYPKEFGIEEERLEKEHIKKQLQSWAITFNIDTPPIDNNLTRDIWKKFESFIKWANSEIEKL